MNYIIFQSVSAQKLAYGTALCFGQEILALYQSVVI